MLREKAMKSTNKEICNISYFCLSCSYKNLSTSLVSSFKCQKTIRGTAQSIARIMQSYMLVIFEEYSFLLQGNGNGDGLDRLIDRGNVKVKADVLDITYVLDHHWIHRGEIWIAVFFGFIVLFRDRRQV
jgi:hypothetical protein